VARCYSHARIPEVDSRERLLENHWRFLAFLERRVGDRALAEDILQICACARRLAATLKPEYAGVLEVVDVGGASLKEYASREGLTANNAAVRAHRARQALKRRVMESCGLCAEHGCVDCTCRV